MNPDAIIAGLQQELETCRDPEHRKEIRKEIEHQDGLERPTIITETASLAPADFQRAYLDGLRQELEGAAKDRVKEIKAEITRVEKALKPKALAEEPVTDEKKEEPVTELTPEEIEQRRQARTDQGVEQARSAPVPGQTVPAETAPAQGAEEKPQQ